MFTLFGSILFRGPGGGYFYGRRRTFRHREMRWGRWTEKGESICDADLGRLSPLSFRFRQTVAEMAAIRTVLIADWRWAYKIVNTWLPNKHSLNADFNSDTNHIHLLLGFGWSMPSQYLYTGHSGHLTTSLYNNIRSAWPPPWVGR